MVCLYNWLTCINCDLVVEHFTNIEVFLSGVLFESETKIVNLLFV